MKFQLDRSALLNCLQVVHGVVERRERLPILSNILVALGDETISMTATDMEIELVARTSAPGGVAGEVTVPARKLVDICRTLPEDAAVEFSAVESRANVRAGRSRFTLNTLPSSDFPTTDAIEGVVEVSVRQRDLKELFERTQFAMANQDVRYYLNGLLLEFRGNRLRAVSTDGHRLAQAEVELQGSSDGEEVHQCILPRKGVHELMRLIQNSDDTAKVVVGKASLQMAFGDVTFTSRLIEGRFPDYNRVIPRPEQCDKEADVDRELARRSLQRASILSNEKYRTVRLSFTDGSLHVAANNPDHEEAEDEVDIQYTGDSVEIGFNVGYLIDALGVLPTETVTFHLSDPGSSCLLTPKDDDGSCRYVVMPMRL
ncbi:MAG: DNA polymerase III subunit beta [Immundisolibacterales bacterium]|nr:DNA polymerase III subunit beta [Immundisolibacterales bacterium]